MNFFNFKYFIVLGLLGSKIFSNEIIILSNIQENNGTVGNPSEYCILETGKKYRGFHYRIFGKNLFLENSVQLKANKIYLIKGYWKKDLTKQLKEIGTCNPKEVENLQIRSDWLPEENYFQKKILSWKSGQTTWERLKELEYFHAKHIEEYNSFECHLKNEKAIFSLELDKSFKNLKIKVISHYESTRGKPKPKYFSKKVRLQRKNELEFPLKFIDKGRYNLQEISLQATIRNGIIYIHYPVRLCTKN